MAGPRKPRAPIDDAERMLARRALTRSELAARLARLGHDPEDVARTIERLESARLLGDAALARRWAAARATEGRGRERTVRELVARGVDPETARRGWEEAESEGEIDPGAALARAVRRRLGDASPRLRPGRLARVYNALLSEGFEPDAVASALAPYGLERTPE